MFKLVFLPRWTISKCSCSIWTSWQPAENKCFQFERSCSVEPLLCYSTSLNVLERDLFSSPCWHGKHILYCALSDRWGGFLGWPGKPLSPPVHFEPALPGRAVHPRHTMTTNQPPSKSREPVRPTNTSHKVYSKSGERPFVMHFD